MNLACPVFVNFRESRHIQPEYQMLRSGFPYIHGSGQCSLCRRMLSSLGFGDWALLARTALRLRDTSPDCIQSKEICTSSADVSLPQIDSNLAKEVFAGVSTSRSLFTIYLKTEFLGCPLDDGVTGLLSVKICIEKGLYYYTLG
jgi:hypothetical protein